MGVIVEPAREVPVVAETDVLVCGGGVAGVAAAVAAARRGAKVLLLERYGFLGGLATGALVITTPPLDNGLNREIEQKLKAQYVYALCEHSGEEIELNALDPEILKYELLRLLQGAGVEFLLHVYIARALVENGTVRGVVMETKAGRQAVLAKAVVDATGDADVAASAGAAFRLVKKPMTMMFNMVGVNVPRALGFLGNWGRIREVVKQAIEARKLEFDLGIFRNFGAPGVSLEKLVYPDELNVWSGNLLDMDGTDPKDLTRAEVVTREHAIRLARFLRAAVPGFEHSRIEYTATQVGVRATRQVVGEVVPKAEDLRTRTLPGVVAKPYRKAELRIPYGSILPRTVENLLVAGRCISAAEEAMGQLRLIPVCLATGQAAGAAAALALEHGVAPRRVPAKAVQSALQAQGVDLGLSAG
ncbi:MAG: FAD-dependent oxidoreductase [Candidatus Methylomirabilales bacterium]